MEMQGAGAHWGCLAQGARGSICSEGDRTSPLVSCPRPRASRGRHCRVAASRFFVSVLSSHHLSSAAQVEAWLGPLIASGALLRVRGSVALRPDDDSPFSNLQSQLADELGSWAGGGEGGGAWCDGDATVEPHTFTTVLSPRRSRLSSSRLSRARLGLSSSSSSSLASASALAAPGKRLSAQLGGEDWLTQRASRRSDSGPAGAAAVEGFARPVRRLTSAAGSCDNLSLSSDGDGDGGGGGGDRHAEDALRSPPAPPARLLSFRAARQSHENLFYALDAAAGGGGATPLLLTCGGESPAASKAADGAVRLPAPGSVDRPVGLPRPPSSSRRMGEAAAGASSDALAAPAAGSESANPRTPVLRLLEIDGEIIPGSPPSATQPAARLSVPSARALPTLAVSLYLLPSRRRRAPVVPAGCACTAGAVPYLHSSLFGPRCGLWLRPLFRRAAPRPHVSSSGAFGVPRPHWIPPGLRVRGAAVPRLGRRRNGG